MLDPFQKISENLGHSPEDAKFFWAGGPVEVADRTWFGSMFSGVTAFDTDDGVVLVDSGLEKVAPMLAGMIRSRTQAPVHTAVFTQGHVDHAFGLWAFVQDQPAPRVVAHRNMPPRFARYARTSAHNEALNARQFGGTVEARAHDAQYQTFRAPKLPPNVLYDERVDLTVGGLTFEVHHCKGETDDHSWIFCPERSVLCPGDLFIWGVPNAGNPQKVQRYPWTWAEGLRAMAGKDPESMCPGHGGPVVRDGKLVKRMLLETASFLEAIVERTLDALNDGSPPHVDIVHRVRLPVSDSPWLQPVYDEAEFIIRNVVRYYGGWWSGRPSELKPPPRDALAREVAGLAGGAAALLQRAEAHARGGELRLACSLGDFALEAASEDEAVRARVARLYRQRADHEDSLMAINIFSSAAAYAEKGRPFR
ncbi:MAG: MBL fold metallo-hydrolase [Deltaproteobacteria bacterium]|nr:MBL fold metallo-hydrolase [Deltaproteobacteria bacterium]